MYCPECGKKLTYVNYKDTELYVCKDSSCRTAITSNKLTKLNIDAYAKICEEIYNTEEDKSEKYFMLLKENTDQPLLVKNTNNALEKNKNKLCIVQCKTKEDAKRIFKSIFKYINIDSDNIAEIDIIKN